MIRPPGTKAVLGYDIADGVSVEEYERWLADVHFPDLLANPHLDRIEINDVIRPVTATSAGSATSAAAASFYRIVELHFADHDAYDAYLAWFEQHPIPPERGPAGRTDFRFYVLTATSVVDREHPHVVPSSQPGSSTNQPVST